MSYDNWDKQDEDRKRGEPGKRKLFAVVEDQKKKLQTQKTEAVKDLLLATGIVVASLIGIQISAYIQIAWFSATALFVEYGTLSFIVILYSQYKSLKREIRSVLPDMSWEYYRGLSFERMSSKTLNKIYDVNKNTLDKLFDKLKTFSTTWLAVAGGIGSTLFVEILKEERLNPVSVMVFILCAAVIWSIAQDLYGILNYELAKKTKDLALWWIELTM